MKRTLVHDRFSVRCSKCGEIATRRKWVKAMLCANAHEKQCPSELITVHDNMAHHGKPHTWDTRGFESS